MSPSTPGPAPAPAPTTRDEVARDLRVPWSVGFLPDGSALVTLRNDGRVVRIANGRTSDVGTVPGVVAQGEGGLHGIAVSPTFASDRFVFVHHTSSTDNRVVRLRLEADRLVPDRVIVEGIAKSSFHNGGRIAFGPDGFLYVATGDAGERDAAQNRDDLAGKILRVTADGAPAPGNPFNSRVFSLGHRNVQGLAWRGNTLYATEFGQNTYDELNEIRPGANYGWPRVEGRGSDPAYANPLVQWTTDEASPSGVAIVGDVAYVAALRGERVWRVELASGASRPVESDHGRIRDVVAAPDGRIWIVTSNTFRGSPRPGDDRILAIPAG
ncbi:PQQ-dependent sugar dehydrogenase [Mariniluteicoccus flavus]